MNGRNNGAQRCKACQISKSFGPRSTKRQGLATFSLLPIVEAFVGAAGVTVNSERHFADWPYYRQLSRETERANNAISDELTELGKLTLQPEANIIKLPNISASIPQLKSRDQRVAGQGL